MSANSTITDVPFSTPFHHERLHPQISGSPEKPPSGSLSSLVFNVPFPDHVPREFSERYEAERHMDDESHYQEASGLLALEVYNVDSMRAERDRWAERAGSVFHDLVQANKGTLRHVELILSTGGLATHLNLLPTIRKLYTSNLFACNGLCAVIGRLHVAMVPNCRGRLSRLLREVLCSPHKFPPQGTAHLPPAVNQLEAILCPVYQRGFVSHPPCTDDPWSYTSEPDCRRPDLKTFLAPSGPLPSLQHLIIDHGIQINATDFEDDDDEEVGSDYDYDGPRIEIESHSWPARCAFLAAHQTPLRSLSAALLDVILPPAV
ncbi:hypothetical protein DFH09DRAFT_1507621 [Mycena vulgaris]|nr:hypothetical protein DFH09DRAFT_1507621 [Mycena vulgaris]